MRVCARVCVCVAWAQPEGLGINRGFLHVLDCADLARSLAAVERRRAAAADSPPSPPTDGTAGGGDVPFKYGSASYEAALAACVVRREELYAISKRVSGQTQKSELRHAQHTRTHTHIPKACDHAISISMCCARAARPLRPPRPLPRPPLLGCCPFSLSLARPRSLPPSLPSTLCPALHVTLMRGVWARVHTLRRPIFDARRQLAFRIDPCTRYTHLPRHADWAPRPTMADEAAADAAAAAAREAAAHAASARAAEAAAEAAAAARTRREKAERYECEVGAWALSVRSAQAEFEEAAAAAAGAAAEARATAAHAAAARTEAAHQRRRSAARAEEIETSLAVLEARVVLHEETVRELERVESSRGALSDEQAVRRGAAHARLDAAHTEAASLRSEQASGDTACGAAETVASAAEATLQATRLLFAELEARKQALAIALQAVRRREPDKPVDIDDGNYSA
jgi:hypothetical protein